MSHTIASEDMNTLRKLSIEDQLKLAVVRYGGSLEAQLAGAAITIVLSRIVQLPEADQISLYECMKDLSTASSQEDFQDTMETILEILDPSITFDGCLATEELDGEPTKHEYESWLIWVGGQIKEARTEKHLTQQELSETTGIQQSHLSRLENGQHSPSGTTLQKIADALEVDASRFQFD